MDSALRSARMVEAALAPEVTRHMSRASARFLMREGSGIYPEGIGPLCLPAWPLTGGKWPGKLVKVPERVTCWQCLQELSRWGL